MGCYINDRRIVEKAITTLPEKYESKISSLEDSRDLTTISMSELINAMYAQEQRRASIEEGHAECAFQARNNETPYSLSNKVCKNREQQQHTNQAQAANENQVQEELAFITSSFAVNNQMRKNWLIDSGCTNHIVSNESMFKRIDKSFSLRIRFGNDQIIKAKGKRDVRVSTPTGTKFIIDVLFVPDIDQNLLSVGQLIEKNYSVIFESKKCIISESHDHELMSVEMKDASFVLMELSCLISAQFEVAEIFWKFKAAVDNQACCKLRILKSDNGTKCTYEKFQKFCEYVEIEH
ncbi:uncharacterized protein [Gossypium hirsutum]|uniref:Retrovirus-related Pol polyprotein from transposon TNT 1-94-like beta-barrel domain-containing protein n=1 Tax=Gossypium hirsutum TaxID=3635 RepID=A0ABM3A921_GOSHI|nr:uncharacterized protein LOC121218338 [Gossypium hirsutum]